MTLLAFDTATSSTAVAVLTDGGSALEARDDPAPGERPRHATRLLSLVEEVLARAGAELAEVTRIAVGVGPGSFTGLRIGVATARALAQATGAELIGVSTLHTLAAGAEQEVEGKATVLAAVDARRGEAFAAAWRGSREVLAAAALAPADLAAAAAKLDPPVLAIGSGTLGFRAEIESSGAAVPPDDHPVHRVSAAAMCRLAGGVAPGGHSAVLPDYRRLPDAELSRRGDHRWPPPTP